MANFCLKCNQIYRDSIKEIKSIPYDDKHWLMCPKNNCYGKIIEVDELMLPIIMELNKKGYISDNCCAGHYYDELPYCYIRFAERITFETIPKGFSIKYDDDNHTTIENSFGVLSSENTYTVDKYKNKEEKLYKLILLANIELLKWAKKLPKI